MPGDTGWLDACPPERFDVDGIVVRAYTPDDAQRMVDAVTASIEHLRPRMPWIAFEPQTVQQRREFLEGWVNAWIRREEFNYGLFSGESLVGSTGLHVRSGVGTLEIGYWVHVDHVNKGLATLAARTMLEAAFGMACVEAVEIVHDSTNLASRRVPEKLGFRFEGEFLRSSDAVHSQTPLAPADSGVLCRWRMAR